MAAIQERGFTGFLGPVIKMEVEDSLGPESEEAKVGAPLPKVGSGGGGSEQTVKQESEEEPSRIWDAQLEKFLRTLQSPPSGVETLQQSHPQELQIMMMDDESHLDATHSGKEETAGKGAVELEIQRQHFRMLIYQEGEGPRNFWGNLRKLCQKWLVPERRTKEQILDLVTLEQFLAALPPDMQKWLRGHCPQTCSQAVALAEDFLLMHQGPKDWEGQEDPEVEEKRYTCWNCGESFSSSSDLMTHERAHVGEKMYKCSHCGEFERTHKNQVPCRCSHCGNTSWWNQKDETQSEDKTYTCSKCGKQWGRKSDLLKHERIHRRCSFCGLTFLKDASLELHQRIHTGEEAYTSLNSGESLISHSKVCSYCGKGFSQKTELAEHEKTHATKGMLAPFEVSSELVARVQTHAENPLECSVCGETFKNILQHIAHQKVHKVKKQHKCSSCGKSFTQVKSLTLHKRIHARQKPHKGRDLYTCFHCEKTFRWRYDLVVHELIHTEENPFKCSDCEECFSSQSSLLEHSRSHTGPSLLSCSYCGKMFTSSSVLLRHQKFHVAEDVRTCSQCGKAFKRQSGQAEGEARKCPECTRSHELSSDQV